MAVIGKKGRRGLEDIPPMGRRFQEAHCNNRADRIHLQYPRAAEGEKQRCGEVAPGQGELRVLRAGENASPAGRHHLAAGQGLDHKADHILPQITRLFRSRRPPVEPRHAAAQ
jgi:hypothetical protein